MIGDLVGDLGFELARVGPARRHRRALAIVARLLSQDHFSEKADMVACSALNSFEEKGTAQIRVKLSFKGQHPRFRPAGRRVPFQP